jgi:hypothetical protein
MDAAMLPEPWPSDDAESTRLLARLVHTIDERGRSADYDLLAHFFFTAWPTVCAQVQ